MSGHPGGARQLARGAVLAAHHPAAAASFQSAALVHRTGVLTTAGTPHVTLPTPVHRPSRPKLVVHRADLAAGDVVDLDGLRVTDVPRTVRDLAWPAARIGIEADGKGPHSGLLPVFTDRWRTNALVGWLLLRFTWYDVLRRPAVVIGTVRAHLRGAA